MGANSGVSLGQVMDAFFGDLDRLVPPPRTLCKPTRRRHEVSREGDEVRWRVRGPRHAVHLDHAMDPETARSIAAGLVAAADAIEKDQAEAAQWDACAPFDVPGLPGEAMPA